MGNITSPTLICYYETMLHDLNGKNDKSSHSRKLKPTGSNVCAGICLHTRSASPCWRLPLTCTISAAGGEDNVRNGSLKWGCSSSSPQFWRAILFSLEVLLSLAIPPTPNALHVDKSRCLHKRTWPSWWRESMFSSPRHGSWHWGVAQRKKHLLSMTVL